MEDFRKLFDSFASLKVGVIGDLMLDTYNWGTVERISPEAPVPVVSLAEKGIQDRWGRKRCFELRLTRGAGFGVIGNR